MSKPYQRIPKETSVVGKWKVWLIRKTRTAAF